MFLLLLELAVHVLSEAPVPELSECFTVNGRDYRGTVNYAGLNRIPCLYWNQTIQHRYNTMSDPSGKLGLGDHNYCRNPDSDVQPWCYISETEKGKYWKYCDLPTCHIPGYLGCFMDKGPAPALPGASGTSEKLTIKMCIQFCHREGYQYAGVEAGYACFCGSPSDVTSLQRVSSSQCDHVCFGKSSELCGGDGKLSVYSAWIGACHRNISSTFGVLYSPDFPDEYGAGSACSWDVWSPGSIAIELRFRYFDVLDTNDVVEVRDGQNGSRLLHIPGGQDPPDIVTFPTGHVHISFHSEKRGHDGGGFAMIYRGLGNASDLSTDPYFSTPINTSAHLLDHTIEAQNREDNTASKNLWLLLAVVLSLLVLGIAYVTWRYATVHSWRSLGAEHSPCSMFYRHEDGQSCDLSASHQSSMKSLL